MAGGRRIPVTVDADTKGDFDKAADGLEDVAKKADGADGSLRKMSKGAQVLDAEIGKVSRSVKDLRAEFEKTGDIDLLKDARKLENNRKGLERLKADFVKAGEESGKGFVAALFTDASGAIGGMASKLVANPALLSIGGAVAVPVATGLASALSGAALAGTAAAGIAGGIVLASSSPAVRSAWSTFATGALDSLQDAAIPFEEPLVRAAKRFGDELDDSMPAIRRDFQILAPLVEDLADGAADFVGNLQPGLADAFEGAVPVIEELSDALPRLGDDVSFFFSELGGAGAGGASALGLTVDALGGSLRVLGTGLHSGAIAFELFGGGALSAASKTQAFDTSLAILTSAPMWDMLDKAMHDGKSSSDELGTSVEDLKRRLDEAGQQQAFEEGMKIAAQAMRDGRQAAEDMQHQLSNLATQILSGKDAELAAKQGRLDMIQTLKDSKGAIDGDSEAGIRAQESMVGQAQKAVAVRDAILAKTRSMETADAAYDGLIAQIYADAAANGYSKEKVDGVIGSLRNIPRDTKANIELKNAGNTKDDIREINRGLHDLNGKTANTYVTNHVITRYSTEGERHAQQRGFIDVFAAGGIRHAAVGMIIPPSDPGTVLTAEPQTGGEVLIPMRGIDTARAAMLGRTALDGYGLDVVPKSGYVAPPVAPPVMSASSGRGGNVSLTLSMAGGGSSIDQAMAGWFMYALRTGQIQLKADSGGTVRVA